MKKPSIYPNEEVKEEFQEEEEEKYQSQFQDTNTKLNFQQPLKSNPIEPQNSAQVNKHINNKPDFSQQNHTPGYMPDEDEEKYQSP